MATTENLKVKITADASQAKAEIGKFKDSLKGAITEGEAATKSIGKLTTALGGMLVAVKAVKALVKNGIDIAAQGDAIKDNAQKVFMNTTAYQEWGYVLKQNGIEITALKTSMKKFSQEVAAGSPVLAKYGITATDVGTAFEQAIYTIQNMTSETEKIAAATELFGSRAIELMPILNLTNGETQALMETYRLLGATMSNELIAASDVCTDSITAMKAAWGGLRNVIAAYVIPIITKVVKWITIAIAYLRIFLAAVLGIKSSFGSSSGKGGKGSIAASTGNVASNTGKTAKNLGKAAKHAKELKRTLMGIDELTKLVEQATAAASGGGGGGGGGGIGDIGGGIDAGELGDLAEVFDDATLEKLRNFRDLIESISGILNGLYLIMKGLVEISLGNWVQGWTDIKEGVSKVWQNIKELFPWIGKLETAWNNFKKAVKEKITTAFNDKIAPKIADLKKKWTDLKKTIKDIKAKLVLKITGSAALNKVKKAWEKVKSKTVTITLKFVEKIKNGWNKIAKKVNDARAKGGLAKTLLPEMPYLAKGGVLTAPTAAIMGEYAGARSNPEIATPQSLMSETIKDANGDLVSAFATMTRQVIAAIENKDMTIKIGDETIARSAQRGNTAYKNRTGKALITI